MLGRQRSLDLSWCGRGFSEWVGCHIWGRPGWWEMAAVMMREEPVSGRQGQAALLLLPPRSKCHLCESAATWPQGTLLPDAPLPPSWSKSQTPSWPLHLQWTFLGLDFMVSGSADPAFFLPRMFTGLWKEQRRDWSCSWLHHWASFLALSLPLLSTYCVWVSMLKA